MAPPVRIYAIEDRGTFIPRRLNKFPYTVQLDEPMVLIPVFSTKKTTDTFTVELRKLLVKHGRIPSLDSDFTFIG